MCFYIPTGNPLTPSPLCARRAASDRLCSELVARAVLAPFECACWESVGAIAYAEGSPVAPVNKNGRGRVFHQHELVRAHVSAAGLDEEGFGVLRHFVDRTVVEDSSVAAVGGVPLRVGGL